MGWRTMLRRTIILSTALIAIAGCATLDPAAPAQSYRALGTEPFWNLAVEPDGRWTLRRLDFADAGGRWRGSLPAEAPPALSGTSTAGERLVLAASPGACSDGMSDNLYAHHARVTFGTTTLTGCGGPIVSRLR